jgi:hypothetical protein
MLLLLLLLLLLLVVVMMLYCHLLEEMAGPKLSLTLHVQQPRNDALAHHLTFVTAIRL